MYTDVLLGPTLSSIMTLCTDPNCSNSLDRSSTVVLSEGNPLTQTLLSDSPFILMFLQCLCPIMCAHNCFSVKKKTSTGQDNPRPCTPPPAYPRSPGRHKLRKKGKRNGKAQQHQPLQLMLSRGQWAWLGLLMGAVKFINRCGYNYYWAWPWLIYGRGQGYSSWPRPLTLKS